MAPGESIKSLLRMIDGRITGSLAGEKKDAIGVSQCSGDEINWDSRVFICNEQLKHILRAHIFQLICAAT